MAVITKNCAHPKYSTNGGVKGPARNTRPTDDKAVSSANCVAVNLILHSPIISTTNAAVPIPPVKFSKPTAKAIIGRLFPVIATKAYIKFDTDCRIPKLIKDLYKPSLFNRAPPSSAPKIELRTARILLTQPTVSAAKPAPRIKKVVESAPANESPSLYKTISNNMAIASFRVFFR